MSITPAALRRLMRELSELQKSPPEGIRVQTNDDNVLDVVGIIEGPEGTPYAGGYFKVKFRFTEEFPAAPPKCTFMTKIFHPNVSSSGEICVNTLKKDWKSTYGIGHILVTVKCLLIYPNPESALDEEAGKLLLEDYQAYASRAKLITSVHATPRTKPVEFLTPSASGDPSSDAGPSTCTSPPSMSASALHPPTQTRSPTAQASLPILVTSKPPSQTRSSPAPTALSIPLTSSPTSNKESSNVTKERHPSPAPLSTSNANIENDRTKAGAAAMDKNKMSLVSTTASPAPKAVKRAAAGGGATNAEKRKKALKRL
ncbi:ubiquitin-conjugating enzyme/RWD-like protein [Lentinula raphanica]|uniref:E2 ubiquitin-conjugating enzyme n=1 Tax=Lentinula raphanica TaxID=153919 RepID=A0AA38UFY1_9AGAR|nr:ubiquitin-conjugating enzyme/RWD-like protein [Lentinula raphanica]KAJ3840059.1 ubiquitin-conjugating enzyme/RWD-like protein [Lentinula raphanica]KAJ3965450.1 ubiquitin-conjugating enzyme/RWD-like protein [Lentinula raphanica]